MDFYDELQSQPPWRRVGWRAEIDQAYRYEAAVDVIRATTGAVIDVGCGVGGLSTYVAAHGLPRKFVGIEARPQLAEQVAHEVRCADFAVINDVNGGCAVAVGTLDAKLRLPELLRFLADCAPSFIATVLDADGLSQRPMLWAEHHHAAVTRDDVAEAARTLSVDVEVSQLAPTDLLIVGGAHAAKSVLERFRATLEGPWSSRFDATERAWLAAELLLWDEAERWLRDAPRDARANLLRERVAHR